MLIIFYHFVHYCQFIFEVITLNIFKDVFWVVFIVDKPVNESEMIDTY